MPTVLGIGCKDKTHDANGGKNNETWHRHQKLHCCVSCHQAWNCDQQHWKRSRDKPPIRGSLSGANTIQCTR